MHPIEHIRRSIFKLPQHAFAKIAGVTQPTVSRWETYQWEPNRDELSRIRSAAINCGKSWNDKWFFEIPNKKV